MAPGSIFHHINLPTLSYFRCLLFCFYFTLHLYHKNTKKYYLIISIRSHSRKWPWRDWQPLYRVGCEVLICLCRCEGLERGLLLDWYLGSQNWGKYLRYFSASPFPLQGKNQRSAQKVARRISGAVAGESTQKSTYQVPITNLIPCITLFAICLSFSSPPLHPCRFIRPLFRSTFFCHV